MLKKIADGFCCTIGVLLALAVNSILGDIVNKSEKKCNCNCDSTEE